MCHLEMLRFNWQNVCVFLEWKLDIYRDPSTLSVTQWNVDFHHMSSLFPPAAHFAHSTALSSGSLKDHDVGRGCSRFSSYKSLHGSCTVKIKMNSIPPPFSLFSSPAIVLPPTSSIDVDYDDGKIGKFSLHIAQFPFRVEVVQTEIFLSTQHLLGCDCQTGKKFHEKYKRERKSSNNFPTLENLLNSFFRWSSRYFKKKSVNLFVYS